MLIITSARRGLFILFLLCMPFTVLHGSEKETCITDGEYFTVEGTVSIEVFPGKPNYEDIQKDEHMMYWVLTAKIPYTCGYEINFNTGENSLKKDFYNKFQLANYRMPRHKLVEARNRNIRGNGTIKLRGQAVFGHTSYHVTKVVIFDSVIID